jgi:hypothetical protein
MRRLRSRRSNAYFSGAGETLCSTKAWKRRGFHWVFVMHFPLLARARKEKRVGKNGATFKYLKLKHSLLLEAKIKEDVFIGLYIPQLTQDKETENKMVSIEEIDVGLNMRVAIFMHHIGRYTTFKA